MAKRLTSPRSKHFGKSAKNVADELEANDETGTAPSRHAARYVAADRPDLHYTASVLMRTPRHRCSCKRCKWGARQDTSTQCLS